ncbi:MAG: PEP-CTERM sorting domain-containing protein, partial [Planctomycetes bacterium]|nr:PEP-CTERM sorting domain-containing protein [Planctomycetota bacterium]
QNGTFDMMGNVFEWNEVQSLAHSYHGVRGGSYNSNDVGILSSSNRDVYASDMEDGPVGFRVFSVPEPSTLLLIGLGVVMLRRRR